MNLEDTISYLSSAVRAGDEYVASLRPTATDLSLKRTPWPVTAADPFPFDRVLRVFAAQSALQGEPDLEPSIELIESLQLALTWDRVIVAVSEEIVRRSTEPAFRGEATLRELVGLPAQSTYFQVCWAAGGMRFMGVWVCRDRLGESGDPIVVLRFVPEAGRPGDEVVFDVPADAARWDELAARLGTAFTDASGAAESPATQRLTEQFWERVAATKGLVALLCALCTPASQARWVADAGVVQAAGGETQPFLRVNARL